MRPPFHRPCDCAIDLLAGAMPPHGKAYPFSVTKSAAMETYISAEPKGLFALPAHLLRPAFPLCWRKMGSLPLYRLPWPKCHHSTRCNLSPLLEQQHVAQYFTKLNLWSEYNLVCITIGDKWKTSVSTTSGHYEYWVMPYVNAPSVF